MGGGGEQTHSLACIACKHLITFTFISSHLGLMLGAPPSWAFIWSSHQYYHRMNTMLRSVREKAQMCQAYPFAGHWVMLYNFCIPPATRLTTSLCAPQAD